MRLAFPVVAASLLLIPLAAAGEGPTTSTGDVDEHGDPPGTICIPVYTAWTIQLTLLSSSPNDAVALVGLVEDPPVDVAVATHDEPKVYVMGETGSTCKPRAFVVGLVVDGEIPYTIEYLRGFAK